MRKWLRDPRTCAALVLALAPVGQVVAQQATPAVQTSAAQESSSASSEAVRKQKAKIQKVWTNDTITEVRSPSDAYTDKKAAQAGAAKVQPTQRANKQPDAAGPEPVGAPPVSLKMPKTVEEAQDAISRSQGLLENFQQLLATTQEQISTETDPAVRATLEQKAKLLTDDVSSTLDDLKTLEKALNDLRAGRQPGKPEASVPSN